MATPLPHQPLPQAGGLWRPVDAANGVLKGLNHTGNGLSGPEFILLSMMAIANDCLHYQVSIYSLVHLDSLTPKPTINESRPLRFPQIPPLTAPATLLHPTAIAASGVEASNLLVRKSRRELCCRAECIWNPAHILFFPLVGTTSYHITMASASRPLSI